MSALAHKQILLVISGGIAAYKALELIRRLRDQGAAVRCILTRGGAQFVTPLAVGAHSENKVYQDLWTLTDEQEMGHIRLVREADLIIVAPASANLIAKLAHGLADDLASTALLAAQKPILLAPAMNGAMWGNAATQANIATLRARGLHQVGPDDGSMACGETGTGRMAEVPAIIAAATALLEPTGRLRGLHAIVTSGPTQEPIDPVRYIGNRSSGKQGHAIAAALAAEGAQVTLVSGPTALPAPSHVHLVSVQTAQEMLAACNAALPAAIFIGCAAVADWHVVNAGATKLKKDSGAPQLVLAPNPDIVATIAAGQQRPELVIGFAAETGNLAAQATAKLQRKGCDWLLANDVSNGQVFGDDDNEILFLTRDQTGSVNSAAWPRQSKTAVAARLAGAIALHFKKSS